MTKKDKVAFTIKTLERLYPEIPIPLDHQQQFAKRLKKLNRSNRFGF